MTRTTVPDILAGLSIAALLLPEAVAYSGLAGLPPQAGVIALTMAKRLLPMSP